MVINQLQHFFLKKGKKIKAKKSIASLFFKLKAEEQSKNVLYFYYFNTLIIIAPLKLAPINKNKKLPKIVPEINQQKNFISFFAHNFKKQLPFFLYFFFVNQKQAKIINLKKTHFKLLI